MILFLHIFLFPAIFDNRPSESFMNVAGREANFASLRDPFSSS
jgi:hypothetical protein